MRLNNIYMNYFGYSDCIFDFSAEFERGINVIWGASGSGKTTLLKGICGIAPVYNGAITLDGTDITHLKPKMREVQCVFDDLALFNHRTVRYNLEYSLKLRKIAKGERAQLVEAAAKRFQLLDILDISVFRLAFWQRTMIALARLLLRQSEVILLDNPLQKLDINERREAFLILSEVLPTLKSIIIYATDSAEEAAMLSDNIGVLVNGCLKQVASATKLAQEPAALSVMQAFCPYSNILEGKVQDGFLELCDKSFSMDTSKLIGDNYIGKNVLVGFSPYAAILAEGGIDCTVVSSLCYGEKRLNTALITVADTDCYNENNYSIRYISDSAQKVGDKVKLSLDSADVFLFDAGNYNSILKGRGE